MVKQYGATIIGQIVLEQVDDNGHYVHGQAEAS